jgi:hypothetical protein
VSTDEVTADLGIDGLEQATPIGRGGFGTVYRAWQPAFRREVAVKLLHYAKGDAAALRRFDREVAAIGSVSAHPNVVSVYASGLAADGTPYLVMEHLPNGTLAGRVAKGPLAWQEAAAIARKLVFALEFAHAKGILHSDIKPENVLLSAFGEPELADFGIAKIVGGTDTRANSAHLTIPHAPPEILEGRPPTTQSDLYAVASTVMTLILGHPPFHRDEDTSFVPTFGRILREPPPDLRPWGVPEYVARTLEAAMAKAPADRPISAAAMARALEGKAVPPERAIDLRDHDTITVIPDDEVLVVDDTVTAAPPTLSPTPLRRRSRLLVPATAAAAVVVLLAAFLVARDDSPGQGGRFAAGQPATTAVTTAAKVAAGTFVRTTTFRPALRFAIPSGWTVDEQPAVLNVLEAGHDPALTFAVPSQVLDPTLAYGSEPIAPHQQALPADLAQWLAGHPRLDVTGTKPVTVGSGAATRVSFVVRDGYASRYCTKRCVLLFVTADGKPQVFDVGDRVDVDVFSVASQPLVAIHPTDRSDVIDGILASLHVD